MARHTFIEEQVDAGIDAIVERAKDRGQTIRYSAVFAAAGFPSHSSSIKVLSRSLSPTS